MPVTTDQETLQRFIKRRHPEYAANLKHWKFVEATYNGGREWFDENIFKYLKEGDVEFADRLDRCYRFNHTREVVDLVQKYIFKAVIVRNEKDAPSEILDFWKNVTLSGLDVKQFMSLTSALSSIYGRIWVFTDSTKSAEIKTKEDEKKAGARVYAYHVKPTDLLDMGIDKDTGELLWVLVRETVRDDDDPIASSGDVQEQFRLWTKTEWMLFEIVNAGRRGPIVKIKDEGVNELGRVPGFPVDHVIGEHVYTAPGLIDDTAYLDRAVANYLSNLDAIIQDQTFSQLVMPAQGLLPGDEAYNALREMGTKRTFLFDGEGGGKPEYISPDVKQASLIITVINKIINEIYHSIGMAGERTKEDNAVGIDNSSGVAKAYDFEKVNSLLATKAQSLENAENNLVDMVMAWQGGAAPEKELIKYPDNFDVRSLFDEFTIAENLMKVEAPDAVRRLQMEQVVEKLFPRLADDLKKAMLSEIKKWPPEPEPEAPAAGGKPNRSKRNPQTQKRQGQVTAESA